MSEHSDEHGLDAEIDPELEEEIEAAEAREVEAADDFDRIADEEMSAESELAQAHATYLAAVMGHFNPDRLPLPCPTCRSLGYVETQLQADPSVEECAACAGLGVTLTGSKVDTRVTRACPVCQGTGFVAKAGAVEPVAPVAPTTGSVEPLPPETFTFPPPTPEPAVA